MSHERCPNCGFDLDSDTAKSTARPNADPLLIPASERVEYFVRPPRKSEQPAEKRRYKRFEVKCKAAIRYGGLEDDIVDIVDMSKRGLRFYSSKLYVAGSLLQVAVPYTLGGNNIFSSARILRLHRRPTPQSMGEYALEIIG